MDIRNKVLVCGSDNLTSLGIVRELGEKNIPFTFLSIGKCKVVASSKYCKDIVVHSGFNACVEYLKQNYKDEAYKPILIISSDRLAYMFDNDQNGAFSHYILPCSSIPGTLMRYTDKYNMQVLARKCGINCLESKRINKNSSLDTIPYPCFLKPCIERSGHYNEFKYKICKDHSELVKTLKMVRPESEFVAQRYLQKENELVVYGCRMRDGNTIFAGVMYQDRFAESGFASHGYVSKDIPDYIDLERLRAYIEEIDFYGPFDFEFAIENGVPYFLETNFRCVGPTCFFNDAGASVIAAYVCSCASLDYNEISYSVLHDAWCIDDLYDVENVLTRKIPLDLWKKSRREATLLRFYNENDLGPYYAESQRRLLRVFRDIFVKKFRLYIVCWGEKLGLRK